MQVGPTIITSTTAVFTPTVTLSLNVSPAIIVSTTTLFTPIVNDGSVPPVVETPNPYNPTGGGGSNRFYTGKYRGELRQTILKAARLLSEAQSARSKKRKVKKAVEQIVQQIESFDIKLEDLQYAPEDAPQSLTPLIEAQINLMQLMMEMRQAKELGIARANELQALMEDYEREAEALDLFEEYEARQREEEERQRVLESKRRREEDEIMTIILEISSADEEPSVTFPLKAKAMKKSEKATEIKKPAEKKKSFHKIEFTRDENGVINGVKIGE